jgi:hypothetical protein
MGVVGAERSAQDKAAELGTTTGFDSGTHFGDVLTTIEGQEIVTAGVSTGQ